MTAREVFYKHKAFIEVIALHRHQPQSSNINLIEVINAWKKHLKDINSKVIVGDCGHCGGGWIEATKDFYVYGMKEGWDKPEQTIISQHFDTQPIVKQKRKRING